METISQKELVLALLRLRREVCAYGGKPFCDCKYGVSDDTVLKQGTEHTGCPELWDAAILIHSMSPLEFQLAWTKAEKRGKSEATISQLKALLEEVHGEKLK